MVTIYESKEPVDLYIIGVHNNEATQKGQPVFGITDDYATLKIINGAVKDRIETDGFVSICTKEQALAIRPLLEETESPEPDDEDYCIIIYNFVGVLALAAIGEDKKDYLNNYDIEKDVYICDHYDEGSEHDYVEDILILPEYSEFKTINLYNLFNELDNIPNSEFRRED